MLHARNIFLIVYFYGPKEFRFVMILNILATGD